MTDYQAKTLKNDCSVKIPIRQMLVCLTVDYAPVKNSPLQLCNLAKLVFWSMLSFKIWSFQNYSALALPLFVSFSYDRKSTIIERKFKTQNPNLGHQQQQPFVFDIQ